MLKWVLEDTITEMATTLTMKLLRYTKGKLLETNKKPKKSKNGKSCKKSYVLLLYHSKMNIHHQVHVKIIFHCTKNGVFH